MGLGAFVLAVVAALVVGWLAFLVRQTRVAHRRQAPPPNLSPYLTDDELENRRLDKILLYSLIATAAMAVVLPIYYLNESTRQAAAAERFEHIAEERGHEWWIEYGCGGCHGADGGGGAAPYIEGRSGLSTSWEAPSVNDVFYRYSEEEARFWLVYGRPGTPMPAWGVEGGGPLNSQQIDELLAYLESIQIPQSEVVAKADEKVTAEIARIARADDSVAAAVATQAADIVALRLVPHQYEMIEDLPDRLAEILTSPATCTDASAAVVAAPCDGTAADGDRDGVSDLAEAQLNLLTAAMVAAAPPSDARTAIEAAFFDPTDAYSTMDGPTPIPDLTLLGPLVTEFDSIERDLRLTTANLENLLAAAATGLEFLETAQQERLYAFDVEAVAAAGFDGNVTDARRAIGLYNSYCARCHTAGWSAGFQFTKAAGSGAFGPALGGGRSLTQFPVEQDHYDFIVKGSDEAVAYGVNGIGRGWMPGFGAVLSAEDIMLIVRLERALP
ncbi:MAG: cytochrome c [Acidimicrobiia bacterium]|nr:MAG: cytochrome c [Acidimicrobiia bacterium]